MVLVDVAILARLSPVTAVWLDMMLQFVPIAAALLVANAGVSSAVAVERKTS